jgi:hypothetical protein
MASKTTIMFSCIGRVERDQTQIPRVEGLLREK